jgi:uncharacterized protein
MYLRRYEVKNEIVVAICDKELIGRVLREGELVLDLKKHSSFYMGDLTSPENALKAMLSATSINLVGERAVGLAIKNGMAEKGRERLVQGVPHVQIYSVAAQPTQTSR